MTGRELHETMGLLAAEAPAPPADLLDRVATGSRRRRRRQAAVAAFAAVLVLAGVAWAGLRPPVDRADVPAAPAAPTGTGPFRLPPSVAEPPRVWDTWPASAPFAQEPSTTPDGRRVHVLDRIGTGFLLMGDEDNFYNWSPYDRVFRPIVSGTGPTQQDWVVTTPTSIVWLARDRGGPDEAFSVYRTPHGGGSKQLVTVVPRPWSGVRGLYATEQNAYFSGPDGVARVSLTDGTYSPLAGFEGMVTDGTAWATRPGGEQGSARPPTEFRHLVTGETRTVRPAAGLDVTLLRCVPAFCLGPATGGDTWFVQRPDGSHLTRLPYPGDPVTLGAVGGSGIVVLADGVLLDPGTGRFGVATRAQMRGCLQRSGAVKDEFVFRYAVRTGDTCGPRHYLDIGIGY